MTVDTIYALSSGSPPAAIAVIRISGPAADSALETLAGPLPPPRIATLRSLRDKGDFLDRVLVLRFPGPASATGEDLVELHLHGGRAVVAGVMEALGCASEPGEFTRRAFESGRIDLAEAEGLADLLQAETQPQRKAALALASGELSRRIQQWQNDLLACAAELEATLDFSDEGEVGDEMPQLWHHRVASLAAQIAEALDAPSVERLRDGVRVVIAGPPNAGKSTLLNRLIGREAAITSPIPGTTRDVVEAPVSIAGTAFLIVDTAGLRESTDAIEAIGIERAHANLEAADIILWLGQAEGAPQGNRVVLIDPKADLEQSRRDGAGLPVSAKSGEGISELLAMLSERAASLLQTPGVIAINARHREALEEAQLHLAEAASQHDPLICAELLRQSRVALDRVTGRAGVEDMLDGLFGRFCIGK